MNDEKWRAKDENKLTANIEEAKFIYDQAEKKLKEIIASVDLVINRNIALVAVVVAMLTAIIGFVINRHYVNNYSFETDAILKTSVVFIIYLFFVIVRISRNIISDKYRVIGASPRTLFSEEYFKATSDERIREKMFVWTQIENYQESIDFNMEKHNRMWSRFNYDLIYTLAAPILLLVTFILFSHFA